MPKTLRTKKTTVQTKKYKGVKHSSKPLSPYDNIDVKTLEDVAKLTEMIKDNVATLILVYADWCGHCHTYKDDIWKKLASLKGRKIPMAQVNEKVLAESPLAGTKIDGYPTNLLMGRDMKATMNKDPDTGEETVSLPNTRDFETMAKLVSADPKKVPQSRPPSSTTLTPEAKERRDKAGEETVNMLESDVPLEDTGNTVANPPDVEDDLLESEQPQQSVKYKQAMGGSLYASLLEATKELVAPVHTPSKTRRRRTGEKLSRKTQAK
jgi:thiol-disulfide isomerase/thioredoxin